MNGLKSDVSRVRRRDRCIRHIAKAGRKKKGSKRTGRRQGGAGHFQHFNPDHTLLERHTHAVVTRSSQPANSLSSQHPHFLSPYLTSSPLHESLTTTLPPPRYHLPTLTSHGAILALDVWLSGREALIDFWKAQMRLVQESCWRCKAADSRGILA